MNILRVPEFDTYFKKQPFCMIDIGASGGAVELWKKLGDHVHIVGFEPDERAYEKLMQKSTTPSRITYLDTLLYDQSNKNHNFYYFNEQQLSSMLEPDANVLKCFGKQKPWEIAQTKEVTVDTLDNQLMKNNINDVDFIKLDTQGTELMILEGARTIVNNSLFGVFVEVEFTPVYRQQPLFSDVDNYFRKRDFQLFEFVRTKYWRRPYFGKYVSSKGQTIYGDVLYFRTTQSFFKLLEQYPDPVVKKSKLLKAVSIALLYGHLDYGIELLSAGVADALFDQDERTLVNAFINRQKNTEVFLLEKLPDFKGKHRAQLFITQLINMFKKKKDRWSNGAQWR